MYKILYDVVDGEIHLKVVRLKQNVEAIKVKQREGSIFDCFDPIAIQEVIEEEIATICPNPKGCYTDSNMSQSIRISSPYDVLVNKMLLDELNENQ